MNITPSHTDVNKNPQQKCPDCGGPMRFNFDLDELVCDYCFVHREEHGDCFESRCRLCQLEVLIAKRDAQQLLRADELRADAEVQS